MTEVLAALPSWLPLAVAALVVLILLLVLLVLRRGGRGRDRLTRALDRVSYETMTDIVVPKLDEGEIQIDLIVLTGDGFLIVDFKDVSGVVFGSDRMQDWTVINGERRFTFANPQHALLDRLAAVRHIVRDVPVEACILFSDTAEFTKGTPDYVTTLKSLLDAYPKSNRKRPPDELAAFRPAWEKLRQSASDARAARLFEA